MAKKATGRSAEDQMVMDMIKDVERRKKEIQEASERPRMKTNCAWTYVEGDNSRPINLNVCSDLMALVKIAAFLRSRSTHYLGILGDFELEVGTGAGKVPAFTWQGFPVDDWFHDIRARINYITIESKQAKLDTLEKRLGTLVSPELRRKMELEAIQAEMAE